MYCGVYCEAYITDFSISAQYITYSASLRRCNARSKAQEEEEEGEEKEVVGRCSLL